MKRFTNVNIKKERKRMIRNTIISILIVLVAFIFKYQETKTIENANKKVESLNNIIVNAKEKTNQKAYLDIKVVPYEFAVSDSVIDSYYIVSDGKYLYIVYMSPSDFNKLNNEDIYENAIRVEGVTKETSKEIRDLAITVYNEATDGKNKITEANFNDYFGPIYLDMTASDSEVASGYTVLFFLTIFFGGIFLICSVVQLCRFLKATKKLDGIQIDEIDNEMNSQTAFYYEKVHLYLTEHYIINFGGRFNIIRYEDILWMYPFEMRHNGIKTSQSLKVLTKDGVTSTIASIDIITKKKKEVFEEIWNTIISKNNQMLLGYTKENISTMKEKIKEIKNNKKTI